MKAKLLLGILFFIAIISITGCGNKQSQENVEYNEDGKMILKLQRFDFSSEVDNEYESSMVMKNEIVNITGIKFENIEKGMLSEYKEKYSKIIEYIKSKYPDFDNQKWSIMVNMYAADDGNGIIKLNYQIKNMIDTNKSILFTINNNVINRVTFINIDFNVDEDKLVNLINEFENNIFQEKKEFAKNEEFFKEDVTYSYYYNTEELRYTYQLYFYERYGNDRVINNEYGTECIINKRN